MKTSINMLSRNAVIFAVLLLTLRSVVIAGDNPACGTPQQCQSACDNGNAATCIFIGKAFEDSALPDADTVVHTEYSKACEHGGSSICFALARRYRSRNEMAHAVEFFELACRKGEPRACALIEKRPDGSSVLKPQPAPAPASAAQLCDPRTNPCPGIVGAVPSSTTAPSQSQAGDLVLKEYEVTDPPKLISQGETVYPEAAILLELEGKVILELVIDEHGNVTDARVMRSDDPLFNDSALASARLRKYTAARNHGRLLRTYKSVTLIYKLHGDGQSTPSK